MINNYFMQKSVDQLHERMKKINRAYRFAFHVSFYLGLGLTAAEVFHVILLLMMQSVVYIGRLSGKYEDVSDYYIHFSIDPLLYSAPVLCIFLSYISFAKRQKAIKIIFFLINLIFLVVCIVLLCLGFDFSTYFCAICASVAIHAVTIRCFIADKDDALLSKIPGYPHFDPLVMQDIEPDLEARKQVRYREKSAEELIAEREQEYLTENPNSESAAADRQRREEERERQIEDWLDGMMKKKE